MRTERRPAPDALLEQLDLAAPTVRGGWRGEIGAGHAVVVSSPASPDVSSLVRTLRATGIVVAARLDPADLGDVGDVGDVGDLSAAQSLVIAVDEDDRPGHLLAEVNRHALAAGLSWLPVSAFDGAVVHVGPVIVPGRTACFECLRRRLSAVAAYASLYDSVITDAPAVPMPADLRARAYALAAASARAWLTHRDDGPAGPGRLCTLVAHGPDERRDIVLRVPRCSACGGADRLTVDRPHPVARVESRET